VVNRQILDIGLTFGRQIAILGIGLASLPLLAWVLGPEGLGAFTLLAATLAIASTLACGGIGSAYLFFAGKSRLRKDSVSPVVWKQIFVGFFVGGACVAAATPFLLA
jgi:O-antigen/teichoic acid export membrane protein